MAAPTRILYDGRCSLCCRSMERLAQRDTTARLQFIDLHTADVSTFNPPLNHEACRQEIHAITPAGEVVRGFDAFRHIWAQLPSMAWWNWLLYLPPVPYIGRKIYTYIARKRYGKPHEK